MLVFPVDMSIIRAIYGKNLRDFEASGTENTVPIVDRSTNHFPRMVHLFQSVVGRIFVEQNPRTSLRNPVHRKESGIDTCIRCGWTMVVAEKEDSVVKL